MALITVGAGRCWRYSHNVGMRQTIGAGFTQPIGVGLAGDGVLFVANRGGGNSRVSKVTVDHDFLMDIGRGGEQPGQFKSLSSVAVGPDGNVYTSDEWLHRVTVFAPDGKVVGTWGEAGDEPGQLDGPAGLAFDRDDNVVIVNSFNSRVQRFTSDGRYLSGFGKKGADAGELDMPYGVAVDNLDNIYVADWNNHRVQKFSADGDYLLTFGSGEPAGVAFDGGTPYAHATLANIGVSLNSLNHPTGVTVDQDGDVYICDWMNERIVIFDSESNPIAWLRGDAHDLSKWAQMTVDANPDMADARRRVKNPEIQRYFRMPVGCAFDQENNLLIVCDTAMCRLQIYEKDRNYQEPQINL